MTGFRHLRSRKNIKGPPWEGRCEANLRTEGRDPFEPIELKQSSPFLKSHPEVSF